MTPRARKGSFPNTVAEMKRWSLIDVGGEPRKVAARTKRVEPPSGEKEEGLAWATFRYGRFVVVLALAIVDEEFAVVSVQTRGVESSRDQEMAPIRSTDLRNLPLDSMRREAGRRLLPRPSVVYGRPVASEVSRRTGRPRQYPYGEVAAIYAYAVAHGQHPLEALGKRWPALSRGAAANLVSRAQEAGFLQSRGKGKTRAVSVSARPDTVKGEGAVPPAKATSARESTKGKGKRKPTKRTRKGTP